MAARTRGRVADAIVGGLILAAVLNAVANRTPPAVRSDFTEAVDHATLAKIAVQHNGRLKSFDSYARSMMKFVSGPRSIRGQSAAFTYLDLIFRPAAYAEADLIYVKHKDMRHRIAQRLATDPAIPAERLARFQKIGLLSPVLLSRPEVDALLDEMSRDLIRTSKFVAAIRDAQAVSQPSTLSGSLRIIPAAGDELQKVWFSIDRLWRMSLCLT